MKFVTYCDQNYAAVGSLSLPRMIEFCRRSGFQFKLHSQPYDPSLDVYWNRLRIISHELTGAEWVCWCDADVLIQRVDYDWRPLLASTDKNLLVSSDYNGLCLGFFFVRECRWAYELFKSLIFLGNIRSEKIGLYDQKNQREQDALKVLMDFFGKVQDNVELLPQSRITNPLSGESADAFAHHFWGNTLSSEALVGAMQAFSLRQAQWAASSEAPAELAASLVGAAPTPSSSSPAGCDPSAAPPAGHL